MASDTGVKFNLSKSLSYSVQKFFTIFFNFLNSSLEKFEVPPGRKFSRGLYINPDNHYTNHRQSIFTQILFLIYPNICDYSPKLCAIIYYYMNLFWMIKLCTTIVSTAKIYT